MNQCTAFQEQLSEFIDGRTRDDDAAPALAHAGVCRECRAFLSTSLMVRPAAARVFSLTAPNRLDERIRTITQSTKTYTATPRAPFWRRRLALSLSTIVLASFLLISLGALVAGGFLSPANARHPVNMENTEPQMLPTVEVRATVRGTAK